MPLLIDSESVSAADCGIDACHLPDPLRGSISMGQPGSSCSRSLSDPPSLLPLHLACSVASKLVHRHRPPKAIEPSGWATMQDTNQEANGTQSELPATCSCHGTSCAGCFGTAMPPREPPTHGAGPCRSCSRMYGTFQLLPHQHLPDPRTVTGPPAYKDPFLGLRSYCVPMPYTTACTATAN